MFRTYGRGKYRRQCMSKYDKLWECVFGDGRNRFTLIFKEIERIAGVPIDHAFLTYKKELAAYGYRMEKISMKAETVAFRRIKQ